MPFVPGVLVWFTILVLISKDLLHSLLLIKASEQSPWADTIYKGEKNNKTYTEQYTQCDKQNELNLRSYKFN